jgi:hypothetical protein
MVRAMALVQHRLHPQQSVWGNWERLSNPLAVHHTALGGVEVPLQDIEVPADVLRALAHHAFEKDLLSIKDIGDLITAMHSLLDLERIRAAGVRERGWRDEVTDVFDWILEGVRLQKTGAELGAWIVDIAGEVGMSLR